MPETLKIIRDSREQSGFTFAGYGVHLEDGTLATGDYAPAGLESLCACERKSLPDLIACLTSERDRFTRELDRARGLDAFLVVVEAPWSDLAAGNYRSRMTPAAACQSVLAMMSRGTPFFFAGSRAAAEYAVHGFLRHFVRTQRERLRAILRAHGGAA